MEFSIRHFISGRIRLHLPSLCRKKAVAEGALVWLQAQHGVKSARLNYTCASLVIEYDVKSEAMLRAMLGRLSGIEVRQLSPADLDPVKVWMAAEDRVHRTWERSVKYYENLRLVFEIQTQLKEWTDQADSSDVKKEAK